MEDAYAWPMKTGLLSTAVTLAVCAPTALVSCGAVNGGPTIPSVPARAVPLCVESVELGTERVEGSGAMRVRDAIVVLGNIGPGPVEVTRMRPTVSTVVNTDLGLPPFTVPAGARVTLNISAKSHTEESVVRRVRIECTSAAGPTTLEVLVPLAGGGGA